MDEEQTEDTDVEEYSCLGIDVGNREFCEGDEE